MAKPYEIAFQIRRTMYCQASRAEMEEKFGFSSDELERFLNMRETGSWEYWRNPKWPAHYHDKCSVCGWINTKDANCGRGRELGELLNFCPNCGADMREDDLDG